MIIAPKISAEALAITAAKQNVRVLECGEWSAERAQQLDFKRVNGGLLVQDLDIGMITDGDLKVVTKRAPTEAEIHDLIFAWKVAKFVKSNAIWLSNPQKPCLNLKVIVSRFFNVKAGKLPKQVI